MRVPPCLVGALLLLPLRAAVPEATTARLAALERRVHGRLGVAALDTGTGRRLGYRAGERFPLCSTFKVLLAGAVLARADRGDSALDRRLPYGKADLLAWAPVTTARVAEGGMTVADLCAAAVESSDNTAANLLLGAIGGPPAVTAFARSLGDPATRLDRTEPTLNEARPGDPRDTTTPEALVGDLRALLLGDALTPGSRARLEAWMVACRTGRTRLRAGVPATWTVGDKTGSGARGTTNDVAILRPPDRPPILVAVYLTRCDAPEPRREAALAEAGRLVVAAFGPGSR